MPQPLVAKLPRSVESVLGGKYHPRLSFVDRSNSEWLVKELGWTNGALPQRGLVEVKVARSFDRSAYSMARIVHVEESTSARIGLERRCTTICHNDVMLVKLLTPIRQACQKYRHRQHIHILNCKAFSSSVATRPREVHLHLRYWCW